MTTTSKLNLSLNASHIHYTHRFLRRCQVQVLDTFRYAANEFYSNVFFTVYSRLQHIILGFLWSFGIPVLLKGDLFRKLVSSYVCIFCAILNNLARVIYVISNCHMANTCITGSNKVNKQDDYTGIFEFG